MKNLHVRNVTLSTESQVRITFIINESNTDTLERLRNSIQARRQAGDEVRARLTFEGGDAIWMAREACEQSCDLLIAAGGDGTINEVVNGIDQWMRASGAGREPPRLGIIPLGTANDLAGALEIPEEVEEAVEVAVGGGERLMDVARVEGRCFLNVSTGGFGAEATEEASTEAKRVLGPLAYLVTGVRKFVALEPLTARVSTAEGTIAEGRFLLFAVGNGRRTGGGNVLTPVADPSDGLLDLCLVREMSRVEFLRLLPQLRAGEHLGHPAVVYLQLPAFTLESDEELSVNADGEPISGRKFSYGVAEWKLAVKC
ncbi:MAG TPA: diacylglycerol kinase family protein [Longimicrobiaceae bacterium]